jgi:pimeloyl-ACP methyl ester carboxylesterase
MLTELVTVTTADGKPLDGALYRPPAGTDRKGGILLVHGLTWNFYQGPVRHLPVWLAPAGYTCLALNMRDHDLSEPVHFELSHHDIQAGVDRLRQEGFAEVIVLTHGYACNKGVTFARQSGTAGVNRYILTTLGSVKSYRPDIWDMVLEGAADMQGRALVVQGAADPLIEAGVRAEELVAAAPRCAIDVIMLAGADHYFGNSEKNLADVVLDWCAANPPQGGNA